MLTTNTLPAGITISKKITNRFFENDPMINFKFTNLTFTQLLEIKAFAKNSKMILFGEYGYNSDTQKGTGTLIVSKLKVWSKAEQDEFEEIMGQSWTNFNSFL